MTTNPAETLWRDHLQRLGEFIKGRRQLNQLSQRQLAKLAALANRKSGEPHHFVIGNANILRYLTMVRECAQAGLATAR